MNFVGAYLARLLPVLGANLAVVLLALAGLTVVSRFRDIPMLILLFVISLLQGGLMVRAFGPAVGSEQSLSLGGMIVGWIGLIGWFLAHLVNSKIVSAAGWAVAVEATVYLVIHSLILVPFYSEPVAEWRRRRGTVAVPDSGANPERVVSGSDKKGEQKRRDAMRFACQMLYDRHRSALRKRFPPDRLQDYFAQFLTDEHPADEVEERGRQLQELLREFIADNGAPPAKFRDVDQLHEHFRLEEEALRSLACTEEQLAAKLADLAYEKARAIRELRET